MTNTFNWGFVQKKGMFKNLQLEVSMKLSAPIFILKSQAKALKRTKLITMTEALNSIAQREGFTSWSLLHSQAMNFLPKTREEILTYLNPGDLMLIGARPGVGKTTFSMKIMIQALKEGRRCYFFTLEYSRREVVQKIVELDETAADNAKLTINFSDEISSNYIIQKAKNLTEPGTIIIIDYLQLLDQKRSNPELQIQVEDLKEFAKKQKCILIFISQIDRMFEAKEKIYLGLEDIKLPNPLDLTLFNKIMFLHKEKKFFIRPDKFEVA